MKNRITMGVSVAILLFALSGCDEASNCKFDVQQALDKDDNEYVIDRLETDESCLSDYENNSQLIDLANAYLGAAGINLTDIIVTMSETTGDFIQILTDLSKNNNINTFKYLKLSENNYNKYLELNNESCDLTTNYEVKELCFYKGLNNMFKVSNTLNFLTENLNGWNSGILDPLDDLNQNQIPDDMDTSNCSVEYAFQNLNGNYNCPLQTTTSGDSSLIELNSNLQIGENYYQYVLTSVNDISNINEKEYLISNNDVVMTTGYCNTIRETCEVGTTDCYPCPIEDENGVPLGITNNIANNLNSSLNLIEDTADNELGTVVDDIRIEITGNTTSDITVQDIQTYLEDN